MPISKAIQLFGIDREDRHSTLKEGFDHRHSRDLDSHAYAPWLVVHQLVQTSQELCDGLRPL
jgi:hypothetical protein